jgi:AcrR family transcriptional regulator
MQNSSTATLAPRRRPSQNRSVVTVDAIFEASIQVLLTDGMHRLTTTRVAERAGVSAGTLYQYFPNKHALLYAVLARHLDGIASAVEVAAQGAHNAALKEMVRVVVAAFVRAKVARVDEARALYAVSSELACADLAKAAGERGCAALTAMLATAPDARFDDLTLTAYMFATAMIGPTRGMVEGQAPARLTRVLRAQLNSLCLGYLERESISRK